MTVEDWKTVFDWFAVILLFLTFASGTGALITGSIINKRQAAQLRQFDLKLTESRERAANLEVEALQLKKQLIAQGPRPQLLYGEDRERLINKLKPFAGQKVEVRYCFNPLMPFAMDQETLGLAMLIQFILSDGAKWSSNPLARENCGGTGISISVHPKASDSTQKAANALLEGFTSVPLAVIGPAVQHSLSPRFPQPSTYWVNGKPARFAPLGTETIVVTVLAHP